MKTFPKVLKVRVLMAIALAVCCCGCGKELASKEDMTKQNEDVIRQGSEELIEQIFDISEIKYKIIEESNSLSDKEYGGSYSVVIKLEKEDVPSFIAQVEERYYIPENIEEYSNPIWNTYGKELGERDTFYTTTSGVRRTLEGVESIPKSCGFYIICSEKTTGEYEVKMVYCE